MAYPVYNHPADVGYHRPQYHDYSTPFYQQPYYGTHPYNTHPIYGTPQHLVERPASQYVTSNQQAPQLKPNQPQEGTTAASTIKLPSIAVSHGQGYQAGRPVAISGWYPVEGKSTFSNVLTGGLGLAAGVAIANSLNRPRPAFGYGSNYGRPSLCSYVRPGYGYFKQSYGYGYNHPCRYRRPVY